MPRTDTNAHAAAATLYRLLQDAVTADRNGQPALADLSLELAAAECGSLWVARDAFHEMVTNGTPAPVALGMHTL